MFLAHMMIDAIDTALENREVSLDCICVSISANVFIDRMNDRSMADEFLADFPIDAALVGSEMGVLGDRIYDDRLQRYGSHFRYVETANLSSTLTDSYVGHYG